MNPSDDNPSKIDQHLFDLLVDGELSEQQRRELLVSLDDTEEGWRRCALAFLEAQCWGCELGRISDVLPAESRGEKRPSVGVAFGKHWRTFAAMAASFLVALGLGVYGRNLFLPNAGLVSPTIEVADLDSPAHPAVPDGLPATTSIVNSEAAEGRKGSPDSWQMVSFPVSNGSNEAKTIRLPAIERDTIDEEWLDNLPQGMPPDVVRAIEDSGHRIRSQRRLLPLRMDDGRRLVVPVDQVELHYVGSPAYH